MFEQQLDHKSIQNKESLQHDGKHRRKPVGNDQPQKMISCLFCSFSIELYKHLFWAIRLVGEGDLGIHTKCPLSPVISKGP